MCVTEKTASTLSVFGAEDHLSLVHQEAFWLGNSEKLSLRFRLMSSTEYYRHIGRMPLCSPPATLQCHGKWWKNYRTFFTYYLGVGIWWAEVMEWGIIFACAITETMAQLWAVILGLYLSLCSCTNSKSEYNYLNEDPSTLHKNVPGRYFSSCP